MDALRKLRISLFLLFFIIIGGSLGYFLLYPISLLDAFYMTAITVSTVGFREVFPLDERGKLFTALLILSGVGGLTLTATNLFQFMIEGHLSGLVKRRNMDKAIKSLQDHCIICGFGRVGEQVARDFSKEKKTFVVIDENQEALQRLADRGYLYLGGNATSDEILFKAGIERCKGIVAASDSDPDNVLITLSARLLNPGIFIVARASSQEICDKLFKAGANRVVSPYLNTGQKMASMITKPLVHEYLDSMAYGSNLEILLEEVELSDEIDIVGKTLQEAALRKRTGATILAIKKPDGRILTNPPVSTVLESGDHLILVGTTEQLEMANPKVMF